MIRGREIEGWGNLLEMERLAEGRVNIRRGKPVREERLVGGRGNRRRGKPTSI